MNQPKSQAELLQIIREKGSDFQPGGRNEYNNSNYLVLGYIIEKVSGKTYEQNLQERIISKAKLKSTQLIKNAKHPHVNVSYKYANGKWNPVTETDPNTHSGAGAIISTPADLTTFITALFDGKLIMRSSLETMTMLIHGYGSGIFSYDHGTIKGYGHNGRIEEFYTAVRYFPESKISVAYCTNGINFPRVDLFEAIIKSCFNEKISIPFTFKSSENIEQYIGTYSAENMPVVTISVQESKLRAETQGAQFELEPVYKNYFMNTPSGYYFEFNPAQNELQIKETDNVYFLKRK